MCGIVGLVSAGNDNILPLLVKCLKRLEYRGYDSAGFAFIDSDSGRIIVVKDRGKIDEVVARYGIVERYAARVGIAHTRWATHGPPSKVNAHPHVDCGGTIAIVHNGIINNYLELRRKLAEKGHKFRSDTDTEVIAHLLEDLLDENSDMLGAIRKAMNILRGSYAVVVLSTRDPSRLYFMKRVSPLIVGVAPSVSIVASDIPSIIEITRRVLVLHDGEYGFIEPGRVYVEHDGRPIDASQRFRTITWSVSDIEKAGYPHYMLKEIMEQPRALYETYLGVLSDPALHKAVDLIDEARTVFVTGAGTSFHAGLAFQYYMYRYAGRPVLTFIASEFYVYSNAAGQDDVLIAISQSGETIDTLTALRSFKQRGARVIAVSNVVESAIPRESDVKLYTRAGPEIGVAATKTYLTQVLVLQALVSQMTGDGFIKLLGDAHRVTARSLAKFQVFIDRLARKLYRKEHIYVLGRGLGAFMAYEGALKIKEVSYIHAEAYPAGESKHGPIALVEPGFPVIFIGTPPSELVEKIAANIEEMSARGAVTILIGTQQYRDVDADYKIILDVDDDILAPYAIMPLLQLLAYRLAVLRGYDPDKPRNLAKTVTVE
ncbi:MAG: glutamine--fructose-6-phosphate transaminase (isomerizing) [Crenarchaeota archaeon]|nr:glutamine--fructose-6-phosphate transaminase (isomerizing) [Thermoproteota archaeon]